MLRTPPDGDRRTALKARHRRAIIDAAAVLIDETGVATFTVDELAARADVSRRTIFNHFDSIDDVVTTVCSEVLEGVLDEFMVRPPATGAVDMFDELADVLRATDLVPPMAYLTRVIGMEDPGDPSPRQAVMLLSAFTDVSQRLSDELTTRHPGTDLLDIHLMVSALFGGLVVLHRYWFEATGAAVDSESRRVWSDLLERLIIATRTGHRASSTPLA
ncbi:TetR/AcrR family transcriptional regulator [Occultella glacieicola]|uniref:TetR/AcrR family transcriptional regulator n=1 Tax=Occultella glacieicola TaxID=2518684 RepID=A0ABY2E600_9MICO|nr:TetR/AcrR family transcriptional regulator [Occultella glacieicola]TDE94926.1 TetR/AcrR family transcriptional regulator [Occultella glacieicola]